MFNLNRKVGDSPMKSFLIQLLLVLTITLGVTQLICSPCVATSQGTIGLLVNNAAHLDNEEQASYNFATSNGFSVIIIDANLAKTQTELLTQCSGYWAASDSEPTSWNDDAVINPLKNEISSGKRLLITSAGKYIGQYLGLGNCISWQWGPAANDYVYLVDYNENDHEILQGLPKYTTSLDTNDPNQELWHVVTPGGWSMYGLDTHTKIIDDITLRYAAGWCCWPQDSTLDPKYNFQSSGNRALMHDVLIQETQLGQGAVLDHFPTLTHEWRYGPMGEKLLKNELNWVLSGSIPEITSIELSLNKDTIVKNENVVVSGKVDPKLNGIRVHITQMDRDRNPDFILRTYDAITDENGEFSLTIAPDYSGLFAFQASYQGITSSFIFLKILEYTPINHDYFPDKNGFAFSNPAWGDVPFIGHYGGYCVGMSVGSLDFFLDKYDLGTPGSICNPTGTTLPPEICKSRKVIDNYNWWGIIEGLPTSAWQVLDTTAGFKQYQVNLFNRDRLQELKEDIKICPYPIALGPSLGHCVLVYSIEEYGDNVDIHVYDPDSPNDNLCKIQLTNNGYGYPGYSFDYPSFPDTNYKVFSPLVTPDVLSDRLNGLTITADCPIDLEIIDPNGNTYNKNFLPNKVSLYNESDFDGDGETEDFLFISDKQMGLYQIRVIPELNYKPTDNYSISVFSDHNFLVVAKNISLKNIPKDPYIIDVTNEGIAQLVKANVKIVPSIINIGSNGQFIAFVSLPAGYDVNNVDPNSVKCQGVGAERLIKLPKRFPHVFGAIFKNCQLTMPIGNKVNLFINGTITQNGQIVTFEGNDTVKINNKKVPTKDEFDNLNKLSDEKVFKQFFS
jgi:hypothetical protein